MTNELYCSETANSYKIEYYELVGRKLVMPIRKPDFFGEKLTELLQIQKSLPENIVLL